jgi:hypothetical protein
VIVGQDSELVFLTGDNRFEASTLFSGKGSIRVVAGSVSFTNSLSIEGTLSLVGGGSVAFYAPQVLHRYVHTSGTTLGTGDVTVTDLFSWSSGLIGGPSRFELAPSCAASIAGSVYLNDGRQFINRAQLTAGNGVQINLGNQTLGGTLWDNRGALTLNGRVLVNWWNFASERPVGMQNSGSIVCASTAASPCEVGVPLVSGGVIEVQSGALLLKNGGEISGAVVLDDGALLRVTGGSLALEEGSDFHGQGQLQIEAGTVAGQADLALDVPVNFLGGTLAGTNRLTLNQGISWGGGTMTDAGITEIPPGQSAVSASGQDRYLINGRRLVNRGTFELSQGRLLLGNPQAAGATLENRGTMNLVGGVSVVWWNFDPARPVQFLNSGTLNKSGNGTLSEVGVALVNSGVVNVSSGDLVWSGGGDNSGSAVLASGSTLSLSFGTWILRASGLFAGDGTLRLAGSTLQLADSVSIGAPFRCESGFIRGAHDIVFSRPVTWINGQANDPGNLEVGATASLRLEGGEAYFNNGRRLVIRGEVTATSGYLAVGNENQGGAGVDNFGTLSFQNTSTLLWRNFDSQRPVSLNNVGLLVRGGDAATTQITIPATNSGTIRVETGILAFMSASALSGTVFVDPAASLWFSAGSIRMDGVTFTGTGTLGLSVPVTLGSDIDFATMQVTMNGSISFSGLHSIRNQPGGVLRFESNVTLPGDLRIDGRAVLASAGVADTVTGTFTLGATGTLENPGQLRVGAFDNLGGTILGNAPVVIGVAPAGFLGFTAINMVSADPSRASQAGSVPGGQVYLRWQQPADHGYALEMTQDLITWTPVTSGLGLADTGERSATLRVTPGQRRFFRLRWVGQTGGEAR